MHPAPQSLSNFLRFFLIEFDGRRPDSNSGILSLGAAGPTWYLHLPSCTVVSPPTHSASFQRMSLITSLVVLACAPPPALLLSCSPSDIFFCRVLRSFRLHVVFTFCFSSTVSFAYYELHVIAGSPRAVIDQVHARLRKTRTLLPKPAFQRIMEPSPPKRRRLTPFSPKPAGGPPALSAYVGDPETEEQKRQTAQQFYNRYRELEDRIKEREAMNERLQLHAAAEGQAGFLRPPSPSQATTTSMSRDTSYTGSIVHGVEGVEGVDLGDGQQGGTRKRKTRGGRTGPLDELGKARAAFMRLSKKTCDDCRSRRVRVRTKNIPTASCLVSKANTRATLVHPLHMRQNGSPATRPGRPHDHPARIGRCSPVDISQRQTTNIWAPVGWMEGQPRPRSS